MKIRFSPVRSDADLSVSIDGGMLVVNGQPYDFSSLPVGGVVRGLGPIIECTQTSSGLEAVLMLPYKQGAGDDVLFPADFLAVGDGPVNAPGISTYAGSIAAVHIVEYDPQSIVDRRAVVWQAVKARRDALKSGGVQASGHWFNSDADSRIQQLGLLMMGQNIPAGLQWKTMDNGLVPMTPALAGAIFSATASWDGALFAIGEQLRGQVFASQFPESIDIDAPWPVGFVPTV